MLLSVCRQVLPNMATMLMLLCVCRQVLPNMATMLQQLALNYAAGQVMWAYNTLMLLAFLLDPRLTGAVPEPDPVLDPNAPAKAALGLEGLPQLLDLVIAHEEKVHIAEERERRQWSKAGPDSDADLDSDSESDSDSGSTSDSESRSTKDANVHINSIDDSETDLESRLADPAASLGPVLIRMQNGIAALLTGMAEELQSLQWLMGRLQADPALPDQARLEV